MNPKLKKIKLTQGDKRTINNHSDICTDSHGKGCNLKTSNEKNRDSN